ncbi:MAG TPA: PspC domain-containing protein [Bacteroidota bacterium]|nr:PspC domain-containing protein [Bacteroidota bacterium]
MNKRLYRSPREKMLGGVCGGLAEYFEVDPVLIRILFVVAVFVGGSGILAYIICWIIIPEEPRVVVQPATAQPAPQPSGAPAVQAVTSTNSHRGSAIAGIILIVVGGLFLADNLLPHFHFGEFWPVLLIILGIGILSKTTKR